MNIIFYCCSEKKIYRVDFDLWKKWRHRRSATLILYFECLHVLIILCMQQLHVSQNTLLYKLPSVKVLQGDSNHLKTVSKNFGLKKYLQALRRLFKKNIFALCVNFFSKLSDLSGYSFKDAHRAGHKSKIFWLYLEACGCYTEKCH